MGETPAADVNFVDVVAPLRKRWKPIVLFAVVGAVVMLIVTLLARPVYEAHNMLLMPLASQGPSDTVAMLISNRTSPLDYCRGILDSEAVYAQVGKQFHLDSWDMKNSLRYVADSKTNQLEIVAYGSNKDEARQMAIAAEDALFEWNRRSGNEVGTKQADRLGSDIVQEKEEEVRRAEEQLLAFQKTTVTAPDPSTPFSSGSYLKQLREFQYSTGLTGQQLGLASERADQVSANGNKLPTGINALQKWREQVLQQELELRLAQVQFGPMAPRVVRARKELAVSQEMLEREIRSYDEAIKQGVDAQVAEMRAKTKLLSWQTDYAKRMSDIAPREAVRFQRLLRRVTIAATTLAAVRARYESARVEAKLDNARWSRLGDVYLGNKARPINKRYARMPGLGAVLGLIIGGIWAHIAEYMARRRATA